MLMESYEQSKRTPAYRELRTKYRALKKSHKEILSALTALAQGIVLANEEPNVEEAPRKKRKSKSRRDSITLEMVDEMRDEPKNEIENLSAEDLVTAEDISPPDPGELAEQIPAVNYTEREAEIAAGVDLEETEEVVVEEEEVEELVEEEEVVVEEEVEELVEEEEEIEEVVEEEVEEAAEEEEEETGVYEIEINGKRYYTTNEQDGVVYNIDGEDDVGDEIGKFVNGKFKLNK